MMFSAPEGINFGFLKDKLGNKVKNMVDKILLMNEVRTLPFINRHEAKQEASNNLKVNFIAQKS